MARTDDAREPRFHALLKRLALALGHAGRREPLRAYLSGDEVEIAWADGERREVSVLAAVAEREPSAW